MVGLFWPAPIEYRDAAAAWHLIDPTLVASAGGGWHNTGDSAIASLPANLSAPIRLQTATATVSFGLDGAAAAGSNSGTVVTYRSALPGVDVSYRSKSSSLKEALTLAGPASQRQFSFTATTSGRLSIRPEPSRSLRVLDVDGTFVADFSAPIMTDAAGGAPPRSP